MPTRRVLVILLAAAAASACTAPPAFAVGSLVDLQVVDRDRGSEVLPTYRSRGHSYVAGQPGDRYALRLVNRSGTRVLVVLSVDGINAVSGETAATDQTGYVLGPWQSTDVTGWRKNWSQAAAFYFTALPDSYAARTDRPDNVGVIGAAVFRERAQPPAEPPGIGLAGDAASERSRSAPAASPPLPSPSPPTSMALAKTDKLGTGHGEREYAPATPASFEPATLQPSEIVQLRYDSTANLVAAGVIARPRSDDGPRAFPGFVPDPR